MSQYSNTFTDPPHKDYLVELTSFFFPDLPVIEIVLARSEEEAILNAFDTRNIPSDWVVTEVEEA